MAYRPSNNRAIFIDSRDSSDNILYSRLKRPASNYAGYTSDIDSWGALNGSFPTPRRSLIYGLNKDLVSEHETKTFVTGEPDGTSIYVQDGEAVNIGIGLDGSDIADGILSHAVTFTGSVFCTKALMVLPFWANMAKSQTWYRYCTDVEIESRSFLPLDGVQEAGENRYVWWNTTFYRNPNKLFTECPFVVGFALVADTDVKDANLTGTVGVHIDKSI